MTWAHTLLTDPSRSVDGHTDGTLLRRVRCAQRNNVTAADRGPKTGRHAEAHARDHGCKVSERYHTPYRSQNRAEAWAKSIHAAGPPPRRVWPNAIWPERHAGTSPSRLCISRAVASGLLGHTAIIDRWKSSARRLGSASPQAAHCCRPTAAASCLQLVVPVELVSTLQQLEWSSHPPARHDPTALRAHGPQRSARGDGRRANPLRAADWVANPLRAAVPPVRK